MPISVQSLSQPPCPATSTTIPRRPHPRTRRGLAFLEFAVVIAVLGVLAALALGRVAQLQALGGDALRRTQDAQQQAATLLLRSRCGAATESAAVPVADPSPRAAVPLPGTAPPASSPTSSCP